MNTEPSVVTKALRVLQYDGTNSAWLAEKIDDFTVTAEDATNLTFTSGGQSLVVPRGGFVVYHRGVVAPEDVFANADDYFDAYSPVDEVRGGSHVHQVILTSGPAMLVSGGVEGDI